MSFRFLMSWAVFLTGLVLLLLLATISSASAHAEYKSSVPAADAVVASAPSAVRVTFTEELQSVTLTVKGPDGSTVSTGSATIDLANRDTASVPMRGAGNGRYEVAGHSVSSDDGHEADDTFAFTVGMGGAGPAALPRMGEAATLDTSPLIALGVALLVAGFGLRRWNTHRR